MEMSNRYDEKKTAFILAGGFGTRIKHLLGDVPKPLAQVCNKPFIHWIILELFNSGLDEIVLLTHYRHDLVEAYVKANFGDDGKVKCIFEPVPMGTGGAILEALRKYDAAGGHIYLLNGDTLVIHDLLSLSNVLGVGDHGAVMGLYVNDTSRYGTLLSNSSGHLISFNEKAPGSGYINTGLFLFKKETLLQYSFLRSPLSLELDLIPMLLKDGKKIRIKMITANFIDIGTVDTLPLADSFVFNHIISKN